jgi:peroxisomal coenzyme A diphosphatase NUDT7
LLEKEELNVNEHHFSNRQPRFIAEEQFRKYAVLVPIIKTNDGLLLLFEKRANNLRVGPGEISFPGGKLEVNETTQACAIRETMEELCVKEEQIEIIGSGDIFISPFNVIIYPYLAYIHDYEDSFSTDEVENIIKIPLDFFIQNQPKHFKSKLVNQPPKDFPYEWIPHGENYPWASGSYNIYFYHYNETIIWGITANIVQSIVYLIKDYQLFNDCEL